MASAVQGDGTVWAWGRNNRGQLGDGTSCGPPVPVQVPGLSGFSGVSAGGIQHGMKSDPGRSGPQGHGGMETR